MTMTMNLLVKSSKAQKKIQIYLDQSDYSRYFIYDAIRLAFDPKKEYGIFHMKVKDKYVRYPQLVDELEDIVWEAWSSGETIVDNIRVYMGLKERPCNCILKEKLSFAIVCGMVIFVFLFGLKICFIEK